MTRKREARVRPGTLIDASRFGRIRLSFLAGLGVRALSMASSFLTVPIVLGYLGAERYGLWMTIAAAAVFLGVGDFGLGYGVLTLVAEANGADDERAASEVASSAFWTLAAVAATLALVFFALYPWMSWASVFGAGPALESEARPAVAAFVACFLAGLPLSLVDHLQSAYQENFKSGPWAAGASVLVLAATWAGARHQAPLWALVLIGAGIPVLMRFMNGVFLLRRRPWLNPLRSRTDPKAVRALARLGWLFFVIQVSGLLCYQSDSLILAWRIGPGSVAAYTVVMKLFLVLPNLAGLALMPLWPAYREALVRGDLPWIRRSLRLSLGVAGGGGVVAAGILLACSGRLIPFWTGGQVSPDFALVTYAAVWAALCCWTGPLAMFMNGTHGEAFAAALSVPMTIVNVTVSWLAVGRYGAAGVLIGNLVAQVAFGIIPSTWYVWNFQRKLAAGSSGAAP